MNQENAVLDRYSEGAKERQASLCCPVDYQTELLALLPKEIVEKDYGCGDPSRYVKEGDTVLDLGSGSGKICYMAAQLVGDTGKVIGVDMNDDMLSLARNYKAEMAEKLGNDRVEFKKGKIQDLALDFLALDEWLSINPIQNANDHAKLEEWKLNQRQSKPMIESNSIDLVVSNCVLNLVNENDKQQLVNEIFRVVKPGGRVAISDIISDEPIPEHMKSDPELWSGCISGAFQEQEMLQMFLDIGFQAVAYDKWSEEPWQTIEDIEFRSVTLTAVKPEGMECLDKGQAVIYRGPYSYIKDDDGHEFPRGERMAVCERTYRHLMSGIYSNDFIGITPSSEREAVTWCAPAGTRRPASETKQALHANMDKSSGSCC